MIAENRLMREALTRILSKKNDLCVVGAARFGPETAEEIAVSDPDILLLNPATPPASDVDGIAELRRFAMRFKAVLVGMEEDKQTFLWAVRAGVVGYVLKDATATDLLAALRAVAQGEAVCPPRLCRYLFSYVAQQSSEVRNGRARSRRSLSRREQELVPLIARGLTNREIATHLNLSEQTIKNHMHRLFQKVGATDRLRVVEICRDMELPVH